jgi:predicted PolB exonuclease-like 3'-5' exonuclease
MKNVKVLRRSFWAVGGSFVQLRVHPILGVCGRLSDHYRVVIAITAVYIMIVFF